MVRSATVLVLDTTLQSEPDSTLACDIGEQIVIKTLVDTPLAEVAVVLAGTRGARSTLHEASDPTSYAHITVSADLQRVSRRTLLPIREVRLSRQQGCVLSAHAVFPFDFVAALTVATAVLAAKTKGKTYDRAIYFVTDARHAVVHKAALTDLITACAGDQVALHVVGINFHTLSSGLGGDVDAMHDAPFAALDTKRQNERILAAMCADLGPPSCVVCPTDILRCLQEPHVHPVQQRPLLRLVLRIGDLGIATQIFTLAKRDNLPTLPRSTGDGVTVTRTTTYEVSCDEQPPHLSGGPQTRVVDPSALVEVSLLGADRVLCDTASLAAMAVTGPRALEALVFVPACEVDACVLMGGTRALLPLAGDHDGQRGYHALTDAMRVTGTAMLLRLAYRRDAAPELWACFVEPGETLALPRFLVMAPLPFREDNRALTFSEYAEVSFTKQEEALMDALVEGLAVNEAVLAPRDTLNPLLHQFYATLKAKLTAEGNPDTTATTTTTAAATSVPPLLPSLRGTSTDFGAKGSVVQQRLHDCRDTLAACIAAFPYEAGESHTSVSRVPLQENGAARSLSRAPSTTAASVVAGHHAGKAASATMSSSSAPSERSTASTVPHRANSCDSVTGLPPCLSTAVAAKAGSVVTAAAADADTEQNISRGGEDWLSGIR